MTVVCTRGSRCSARSLATLVLGFTGLLPGCGSHSTASLGTPVITLSDTSGDFAAYRVAINPPITLTDSNGVPETLLLYQTTPESVDLAALTDLTELLGVPAVRAGTYKSATLTLDYTSASIWVNIDRKSTRLNSSHRCISYAVFCLKKKKKKNNSKYHITNHR